MEKFNLYAKDGNKINIELGKVSYDGCVIKVEVKELKKKANVLFKDVFATIGFTTKGNKVVLVFKNDCEDKLLDITKNQSLIDYIWKMSSCKLMGHNLYYYTTEYKVNFED